MEKVGGLEVQYTAYKNVGWKWEAGLRRDLIGTKDIPGKGLIMGFSLCGLAENFRIDVGLSMHREIHQQPGVD